ncbi:MAG: hypothetical protein ACRBN8_01840 [Nannocystales bacterium]
MAEPKSTTQLYAQWRAPRRGHSHAEALTNPVWSWLVEEELSAYEANQRFGGPSSVKAGPAWCFQRMGQTETLLPDGRTVYVAGEHEDYYDPNFYIYNDVVIAEPDGAIDIFGYPATDFPPTDFHTATLVGSTIILIGNLGYPEDRVAGTTQVLAFELGSKRVRTLHPSGDVPGWVSSHKAERVDSAIVVREGTFYEEEICEIIDEWSLDTIRWVWTRLTDRQWPTIRLARADQTSNRLFDVEQFAYYSRLTEDNRFKQGGLASCLETLGDTPDLTLFESRYRPSMEHEVLTNADEDSDEFGIHRISVEGVVVRFNEGQLDVTMTVEGTLPETTAQGLADELERKLAALERTPYIATAVKRR